MGCCPGIRELTYPLPLLKVLQKSSRSAAARHVHQCNDGLVPADVACREIKISLAFPLLRGGGHNQKTAVRKRTAVYSFR